jgi:hypothetical protein
MAVPVTFKQPCPSCEALVTIKETMIGKKVECTKCKDKFIAVRPAEAKKKSTAMVKKGAVPDKKTTAMPGKKSETTFSTKAIGGKKTKAPAIDELEVIEEEDDEPVQIKAKKPAVNGKNKAGPVKSKKVTLVEEVDDDDIDEVDDEIDEKPTKKSRKKGAESRKLTVGLTLAVVGVLVLSVAAVMFAFPSLFLGGGGGPKRPPVAANIKPNPDDDGGNNPAKKNRPGDVPDEPKKEKPIVVKDVVKTPPVTAVSLSDAEIAKLTNLLPDDTEHVFHASFRDLFGPNLPLRKAVFDPPGAFVDADVAKKIGFSLLAIDNLIRAEKYSSPGWSYTVLHSKDIIKQQAIISALKLKPAELAIEGRTYYQAGEANPWFDRLARVSFGIPTYLQMFNARAAGPMCVRFHGNQTMIIGDKAPIEALLKNKEKFPILPLRTADAPAQGPKLEGTVWEIKEKDKPVIRVSFHADGAAVMNGNTNGTWKLDGVNLTFEFPSLQTSYSGIHNNNTLSGTMTDKKSNMQSAWTATTNQPPPQRSTLPNTTARDEMYRTIKPALKDILDRMEARGAASPDKVLFSSGTDMDAGRIDTSTLPEFKDRVVRRPRQFWDVTLLVTEAKPRIRTLGTVLVQRDRDGMKYQYFNEIACIQELDAQEINRELSERIAPSIAFFIKSAARHDVQLPAAREPMPKDSPKDGENPPPTENKSAPAATVSHFSLHQQASTVEFGLDLVLDQASKNQLEGIAALSASSLRAQIETFVHDSPRHFLAGAGKMLNEKGLGKSLFSGLNELEVSRLEVPAGRYPPGAFLSLGASRFEREPRNRIGWMAGLLPYLGQQNVFNTINFRQGWRDPENWLSGRMIVPQFLDSSYPEFTRQVAVGDLPSEFGATHYVGIAGVGLDAASYKRNHPATKLKQGIFSYDGAASLDEVRLGRGTSNTIMMMQVPHDSITGVSPWIAGGGATLRGVPEKNSVAPFVVPQYKGTFALMADGSVRFIDQGVSDEVLKAMCTISGPAPPDFANDPKVQPVPLNKDAKKPAGK